MTRLCHEVLRGQLSPEQAAALDEELQRPVMRLVEPSLDEATAVWGSEPFYVPVRPQSEAPLGPRFDFTAPTTCRNTFKVLRAMQVGRVQRSWQWVAVMHYLSSTVDEEPFLTFLLTCQ